MGITIINLNPQSELISSVCEYETRGGSELLVRTVDVPRDWNDVDELARCVIGNETQVEKYITDHLTEGREFFSGLYLCEIQGSSIEEKAHSAQLKTLAQRFDSFYVRSNGSYADSYFVQMISGILKRRCIPGIDFCHIRELLQRAGEVKEISFSCVGEHRIDDALNLLTKELSRLDDVKRLFVTAIAHVFNSGEVSLITEKLSANMDVGFMASTCYADDKLNSDELRITCLYSLEEKLTDVDDKFSELTVSKQSGPLPSFKANRQ
ncbi:hypothetical protein ACMXYR_05475 [Neptuniibacter sp. QD29_5]|uniref:hypothetical protein n=1 Tax=Neptuniibacter sp. QD29_5 TaxID=3398207 RepID=UPI0039F5F5EE